MGLTTTTIGSYPKPDYLRIPEFVPKHRDPTHRYSEYLASITDDDQERLERATREYVHQQRRALGPGSCFALPPASDRHEWSLSHILCFAAPAHLTAMDGGNAIGLQEQSLPCAMAGMQGIVWNNPCPAVGCRR